MEVDKKMLQGMKGRAEKGEPEMEKGEETRWREKEREREERWKG